VAVKVQYPEVQELFIDDMVAIRRLLAFASPKHLFTLGQLEKQLGSECDYKTEAAALQEVADNMTRHGLMPTEVVVPRPVLELTTRRMLVMELLDGLKLTDAIRRTVGAQAKADEMAVEELESGLPCHKGAVASAADGGVSAVSARTGGSYHRASGTAFESTYRTLAQWCNAGYNAGVWLLRRCGGNVSYRDGTGSDTVVAAMVDTLMRVHGAQLLHDGVFNADPNGGNFLLLRDGRIGLLDFGATKRLTREERLLGAVSLSFSLSLSLSLSLPRPHYGASVDQVTCAILLKCCLLVSAEALWTLLP
jgi:aarF domain-containing kinase